MDLQPKSDTVGEILQRLWENHYGKQELYGTGHIIQGSKKGVYDLLYLKFSRLQSLLEFSNQSESAIKSEKDTWFDIAGYAIIGLMLAEGTYPPSPRGEDQAEFQKAVEALEAFRSATVVLMPDKGVGYLDMGKFDEAIQLLTQFRRDCLLGE